jgi:hypothetical protein
MDRYSFALPMFGFLLGWMIGTTIIQLCSPALAPRQYHQVIIVPKGTTHTIDGKEASKEDLLKLGVEIRHPE